MAAIASSQPINFDTEIRKLPKPFISELGNILEDIGSWMDIMGRIPAPPWIPGSELPPNENYPRKYSAEDISEVKRECLRDGRTGFEALVEEWGTSGRIRPTVKDLVRLFDRNELKRARWWLHKQLSLDGNIDDSDYSTICKELDGLIVGPESYPNEAFTGNPRFGDDVNANPLHAESYSSQIASNVLNLIKDLSLPHVGYHDINAATGMFSNIPAADGGRMLGRGAFGTVYRAELLISDKYLEVAIKKLDVLESITRQEDSKKQFVTELKVLSKCIHKNVLNVEGYSLDGPDMCVIYTYMPNGSLEKHLEQKGYPPLPWKRRVDIFSQTVDGIVYLHTSFARPLVHRDIKPANILLDEELNPKVGDFGLVREGGRGLHADTEQKTEVAVGTSAYMAAEAFRGDISVKMDTYSMGVVLLELLTALPAFDTDREERLLSWHVSRVGLSFEALLDRTAGEWDFNVAKQLFNLSKKLCCESKSERPTMVEARLDLDEVLGEGY